MGTQGLETAGALAQSTTAGSAGKAGSLGAAVSTGTAIGTAAGTVVPGLGNAVGAAAGALAGMVVWFAAKIPSFGKVTVDADTALALHAELAYVRAGGVEDPKGIAAKLRKAVAKGRKVEWTDDAKAAFLGAS